MSRLREKTTATLLIAIFMISAFTVVIPTLNAQLTPTINGVIAEGEWDGATSFPIGSYTGYVTNDEQYMYVAYDYDIKTEGEWANIITYKEGLTPERTYISWVFVEETGLEPELWTIQDTHTVTVDGKQGEEKPDGLFTPFELGLPLGLVDTVGVSRKTNLVCAVGSETEMAIPLTELRLTPGDSIKIMPGLHLLPNTIFVYPDSGTEDDDLTIIWSWNPDHYADYTLWAPPIQLYNLEITIVGQGQIKYTDAAGQIVKMSGEGTWTISYEAGTMSDVFTAQTWKQYPDWEFVSWTVHTSQGDIVSYEPTGFIPMYEHTSVTATFARAPITVEIDIKPGPEEVRINLKSKGRLPVAVLTTDDFDASTIDPETVEFGDAMQTSAVHSALEDVDNDGDIDMIFHFVTQELGLSDSTEKITLTGETVDGTPIEGSAEVTVMSPGK